MKEMETMRHQVIDQMVEDILAKRELLDYFVSTVMESIPRNNRRDRNLCENIVDFTMDEALKDSRVLQLIQDVVSRPKKSKNKGSKKSKRRPKPHSPIHAIDENTEDSFTPSFSTTEPIRCEPESTKRKMKKLKTSELIERRNRELRQQYSETENEPSNTEMSDLNETGTLTFTGKDVLFKLKDRHLPSDNSFSALEINSEDEDHQDRMISDLNSSCSTINNNIPTEGNVDIYASSDEEQGEGRGAAGDDVEAYMSAWENRVQSNLVEDNLEEDNVSKESNTKVDTPVAAATVTSTAASPAASTLPYSLSCTLLSGTSSSTSNMLFFDQSTFDHEVDHVQSGKKEPFHARKVSFSKNLVSDVQYRDKVTPEEKKDMFYNHVEEFRFTRDQSREFAKAEALGLTWNEWIERRTDEDAERDEAEAAAAAEEEGDLLYWDRYGEDEEDEEDEYDEFDPELAGAVTMSLGEFLAGAGEGEDQWAYDAEAGFTELEDAGEEEEQEESESEEDEEQRGQDDSFERRRISGSNDESDWQGAVVYQRTSTAAATASAGQEEKGDLDIVFEGDDTCTGHTDWQTMDEVSDDEEEEEQEEQEEEGGDGSSMDTLEDGLPAQRTTVSRIQKMMRQREVRGEEEEEEEERDEVLQSSDNEEEESEGDLEESGF